MPRTRQGVTKRVRASKWRRRRAPGRAGVTEVEVTALPAETRAALLVRVGGLGACGVGARTAEPLETAPDAPESPEVAEARRQSLWRVYEGKTATQKAKAARVATAVAAVDRLVADGTAKLAAYAHVARELAVSVTTLRNWCRAAAAVDPVDRLAACAPKHAGGGHRVEVDPRAWECWVAFYGRPEAPTAEGCYRDLRRVATTEGFAVPSKATLLRRWAHLPAEARVLAREGPEALSQLLPAVIRDKTGFHALEAINGDQHVWDVFVRWPDGTVARPVSVAWQDLYSGKRLAIRWARQADALLVRLTLGDVIARYGIPAHAWMDNGREFNAKELTGGVPHRFRFKLAPEEPYGVFALLAMQLHLTQPYHGRSKPIERAHRDWAMDVARDPAFAGAYVGNSPTAKPENYGARAVPLAEFVAIATERLHEENARPGRRSPVCRGQSFDQAFEASYAQAPIRRATAEQRRLWLLAAKPVTVSRTGLVSLFDNSYHAPLLLQHRGERVVCRFDPEHLHDQPLHVYTRDGRYLGEAPVWEAVGFADQRAAAEVAKAQRDVRKAAQRTLDAERRVDVLAAAARRGPVAAPAVPVADALTPVFGGAATPAAFQPTPRAAGSAGRLRLATEVDAEGDDAVTAAVLAFSAGQRAERQRRPA